jgi:hypothetical protein
MLFELFCYAIAILLVLFVMAPQVHPDSYTGRPSAIEIEATVIAEEIEDTTEEIEDEWVTLVWPSDEVDEETYDWEYSTCECQWASDEVIEDPWAGEVEVITLASEVYEEPHRLLLLTAGKVNPSIPTHTKGFTPTKSFKKKKGKGAKKK